MYGEIDAELSFEAFSFKRKEKLGGEKKQPLQLSENTECSWAHARAHTHAHTHARALSFAGKHTISRVLSLNQRSPPPGNGVAPSFSSRILTSSCG